MTSARPVRVLFVAGYLRSGSTLLERILGQVGGAVAVGELRYVWHHGLHENQLCGCRRPFRECPFWGSVLDEAFGGVDRAPVERAVSLQRSVDHLWHVPRIVAGRGHGGADRISEYLGLLGPLVRAIHTVAGGWVVVDTSKSASHGYLLSRLPGVDLRVLHLVRDSRATAYSWTRTKPKPEIHWESATMPTYSPARSAFEWDVLNLGAHGLRRRARRFRRMRYEDLAANPEAAVRDVLALADLPAGDVGTLRGDAVTLTVDHTVSGNPIRFRTGEIRIVPDLEWRERLDPWSRRIVTAETWPLLAAYGYLPGVPGASGDRTADG